MPKFSTEIFWFLSIFIKYAFKACKQPFMMFKNVDNSWIIPVKDSFTKVYGSGLHSLDQNFK